MTNQDKEAGLVIWQPDRTPDAGRGEDAGRYRIKAVSKAAIAYTVGALVWYFWAPTVGKVAIGAGTILLLAGMISPLVAFKAINRFLDGIVVGVGLVTSYILLVPTYYLMIAPMGLLLRRGKGDKLARSIDGAAESYWSDVEGAGGEVGITEFKKQF